MKKLLNKIVVKLSKK